MGYENRLIQHAYANAGSGLYEGEVQRVAGTDAAPINGVWTWVPFANNPRNFPNGGPQPIYTTVPYADIAHGASQKQQRRTFGLNVPKGRYDVRVRLSSATQNGSEIGEGDTRGGYNYSFATLRSYQQDQATYKGQQRLGMVIKATGQLSGVVQRFSALATAFTTVYVGGQARWMPTSNPAWWYLDFARGRKNSDGDQMYGCHLDDGQIDVAGIIAWAAFCDAEGLSCNLVVDAQQSAYDTLNDVARCGLASPSWASGKLGVVWDRRNAAPVAAFGMSNIIKGSFSVRYTTENLADEIVVSYIDRDLDYSQQQVRQNIPGVTNPQRSSTLEIKGCTNAWLAGKHANIQAAAQVYRRRQITWDTDVEGFVCQRGDVVILQHDLTQWGYSGRLVGVAGNTIALDRQVPRSGALEYVMLVRPDGDMQTWQVAAGTGDSSSLTLPSPPALQSGVMLIDHRWFFSPLPTPGKRVKIVSVKPVSQYRLQLVATDDDPSFYSAWDGAWNPPANQTLLSNQSPTINDMLISETLVLAGLGVITNRVTLTFAISGKFDTLYLSYCVASGVWVREQVGGNSITFDTDLTGVLEVKANALQGISLGPRFNGRGQIAGKTALPNDVADFRISVSGTFAFLTFLASDELDVQYGGMIKIRHSSAQSGANWNNSADLIGAAPGATLLVPLLSGTYLAKWVDSGGRESRNAALISSSISSAIADLNFVADLNDETAWAGTFAGAVLDVAMGGIKIDSTTVVDAMGDNVDSWPALDTLGGIAGEGIYTLVSSLDLGRVVTSRLTGALDLQTFSATDLVDTWLVIDGRADVDGGGDPVDMRLDGVDMWPDMDGLDLSSARAFFEISTSSDMVAWSAWEAFSAGEWTFRGIRARLRLQTEATHINIVVRFAALHVDMPDRSESGNDIAAPVGTIAIVYGLPFMVSPALAIAAQGMQTGDYYTITGKDKTGFTINFFNASGVLVARTFDYIAKGY